MEGFLKPGIGLENWTSRTNYPARGFVQTRDDELSFYVQENYGQPTARLRRYSLRPDGFASLYAGYPGGDMRTHPLTFTGDGLYLNFATSAAGEVRVEVLDANGRALPGFGLDDAEPVIGNELERRVSWKGGASLAAVAGQALRLRFVMKDAELFSLQLEVGHLRADRPSRGPAGSGTAALKREVPMRVACPVATSRLASRAKTVSKSSLVGGLLPSAGASWAKGAPSA